MTFDTTTLPLLLEAISKLEAGFPLPTLKQSDDHARMQAILSDTAQRLHENYPYHHPLYLGQMLKPPHPMARLAYSLAMYLNPNNHALDGGRASSIMEKEAVAQIAHMFGWKTHLGHLTSGGTFANLEALWVSRESHSGKAVVASAQSHYTHSRISAVLGIPFRKIAADALGRMDVAALEIELKKGDVGTVVVTLGTTAAGTVDPLPAILALQKKYPFRIHIDSAYGGYFTLADNLDAPARAAYDALNQVDSLVIDPHKHGLQPYGCGCVLFRDPSVGKFYQHDSPYTYFTSDEMHLGEISLECSRPGASAVALWATMKLLPLERGGTFAKSLEDCRKARSPSKPTCEPRNTSCRSSTPNSISSSGPFALPPPANRAAVPATSSISPPNTISISHWLASHDPWSRSAEPSRRGMRIRSLVCDHA
ncbi:MAG: aminotransferase class V-fold PLP-dependent enzyme [Gemmatales bacterium]